MVLQRVMLVPVAQQHIWEIANCAKLTLVYLLGLELHSPRICTVPGCLKSQQIAEVQQQSFPTPIPWTDFRSWPNFDASKVAPLASDPPCRSHTPSQTWLGQGYGTRSVSVQTLLSQMSLRRRQFSFYSGHPGNFTLGLGLKIQKP